LNYPGILKTDRRNEVTEFLQLQGLQAPGPNVKTGCALTKTYINQTDLFQASYPTDQYRGGSMTKLSPAQQKAFDYLTEAFPIGNILIVWAQAGMGKTTILEELHRAKGGQFLTAKDFIDDMRVQDPLAMDEALEFMLMKALARNDLVIMDDLDLIYDVIGGCGYGSAYPRGKFVEAILTSVASYVSSTPNKKIVFGMEGNTPRPIWDRGYCAYVQKFDFSDYQLLCEEYLGNKAKGLDFHKIFRFAPKLNAHQLRSACMWMKDTKDLDTEKFIEYMRNQRMGSNVDLDEVEAVDINSLRGVDDVIESLEANIIIPLERDDLAIEYDIQPKRGVLLAGPPGTGKTTIGRALAHRLKSKFFLIDGTFISGSRDFYSKIQRVFDAAKNNAPAIIFIDDSDVIFENKEDFGLYRYLLTMLDGLESESNKRVCIIMTTMDVGSVPPALVRSGRIELWLETRLPDEKARQEILNDHAHRLPLELRKFNMKKLANDTDGLTGADLKRLIDDAKILVAFDKARKRPCVTPGEYFEKATATILSNKEKYQEAEERARARQPSMSSALAAAMGSYGMYGTGNDDDDGLPC
jgi:ATP-dependent 26S proteasome regulatory subunit